MKNHFSDSTPYMIKGVKYLSQKDFFLPLIGQTINTIIPAILPWAVWPIRGNIVPHENGGKLILASLFDFEQKMPKINEFFPPTKPVISP